MLLEMLLSPLRINTSTKQIPSYFLPHSQLWHESKLFNYAVSKSLRVLYFTSSLGIQVPNIELKSKNKVRQNSNFIYAI